MIWYLFTMAGWEITIIISMILKIMIILIKMILIKFYIAEAVDLYKEEGFSKKVAEWNQLRKQAVELALKVLID